MLKIIHVLAVGLWFGAGTFFTFVVGLSLFDTFEKETIKPADERPYWLPVPPALEKAAAESEIPRPASQGAGQPHRRRRRRADVSPYYILQVACGVLGMVTGLVWLGRGGVHRWRVVVLVLALAGAGRWLVAGRGGRGVCARSAPTTSDVVLMSAAPSAEQVDAAEAARAKFGTWHTYSLFANFGTLALVTAAMAMAAVPAAPRSVAVVSRRWAQAACLRTLSNHCRSRFGSTRPTCDESMWSIISTWVARAVEDVIEVRLVAGVDLPLDVERFVHLFARPLADDLNPGLGEEQDEILKAHRVHLGDDDVAAAAHRAGRNRRSRPLLPG